MEQVVYTVQEVAALLRISKSYAYQLVKEKKLPIIDMGKRKLIPKDALEKWLQDNIESYKKVV